VARSVKFELIADPTRYVRGMRQAQRSSEKFTDHTSRAGVAIKAAFAAFSAGAVVAEMGKWVAAARDANRVAAQTDAVIRSTHGAAGLSARGFSDLAKQISRTAAVDDDLVQSGENILATFTNISASGPDRIFQRAEQAAVDMAAAMGHGEVTAEGLQKANIQLGKALNDPLRGITALTKVGVVFSAQQRAQIADFVKHGQTAKAQGVILAEVNREFGGSAAAAVTPAKRLAVTWGNMQEVLGNLLIPALDRGATILNSFLGVVDRNRTAFGLLFGVLGTGAAIIGTLIVAEKVHAAVTDGVKVATKAWAAAQKGLNIVLGTTRVQAAATATSESALAASTTAAGTAATGASAGFATLAGRLALFGGAAAAAAIVAGKLSTEQGRQTAIIDRHGSILDRVKRATTVFGFAQDKAKDSTKAAAAATQASGVASADAAAKMALNAAKATELSGKLKGLRQDFAQQVQSVKESVLAYDGLISKSKVTASEVIRDLHNQTANFKTYSKDVQRLIKAGVSPAAIQELSQKGPQYVHALAVGSNRELGVYKKAWADRQAAVKTGFAASMQKQYEDLVRKIKAMQRTINSLKGKSVTVSADAKVTIAKSTVAFLRATHTKIPQLASGGPVGGQGGPRSDNQLRWLSPGEFVVNARAAARHRAMLEAINAPRMATGGVVGDKLQRVVNADAVGTAKLGQHAADYLARVVGKAIGKAIDAAVGGGVGGSATIKAFIRAVDRLPYRWGGAGPNAYDCCMPGRTLVAGPGGPRRIDELQPGDRVWSRDGGGQLVEQKIVAAWRSIDQATYRLRLRGRNVDASANHPFLRITPVHRTTTGGPCANDPSHRPARGRGLCGTCYHRQRRHGTLPEVYEQVSGYETEWVRLDQLRRGDLVVVLDQADDLGDDAPLLPDGTPVTDDLAWLLGAIIGDGTVIHGGVRVAAFGQFREEVAARLARVWGLRSTPHPTAGLIVNSVAVASVLLPLGFWRRGEHKQVPDVVWGWSQRLQLAFCAGYAAADGSRGRDGLAYHSCSRRLIDEVRLIHMQAGHRVTNVQTNNRDKPITIKGKLIRDAKPLHSFVVSSTEREAYTKLKQDHCAALAGDLTGGHFGIRVVQGIDAIGVEPTYDLTVSDDHNFIADGVVVHNSGLVGAVYGKMRGDRRAGRGARYFTTGSISTRVPGLKPGLGGLLNIGVTAGQGHMAGSYSGLGFEARSTRTGIFTGRAARSPASFARHFHMARGGAVGRLDPGAVAALMGLPGADVGGDAAMTRFAWGRLRRFDRGGWLAPGWNPPMYNGTGRPEPVGGAAGVTVNVTVNGVVATDKERLAAELAGAIHRGLLGYKRGRGNIALGLG
jgi:hypothetical protein